jgi:transposase
LCALPHDPPQAFGERRQAEEGAPTPNPTMPGDSHPPELKERALRMVGEIRGEHESDWAAMVRGAELVGVGTPETLRKWCRQAEVNAGKRAGTNSAEAAGDQAAEA